MLLLLRYSTSYSSYWLLATVLQCYSATTHSLYTYCIVHTRHTLMIVVVVYATREKEKLPCSSCFLLCHSSSSKNSKTKQHETNITKQNKTNQIKSNQIKSNQIKSNQIKSNQNKSNQNKTKQSRAELNITTGQISNQLVRDERYFFRY